MKKIKNLFKMFGLGMFLNTLLFKLTTYANVGIPAIPNPTVYNSLEDIINVSAQLIRPIFILTFAGMILYGAFVWLTSQGDDGKIKTARNIIVAAITGFAIAVFAPGITNIISGLVGIQPFTITGSP